MTNVRGLCLGMVVMLFGAGPSRSDSMGLVINMVPKFFYPEVTQSVTLSCSMTSEGEKAPAVIAMQIKSSPKNTDAASNNSKDNEKKTKEEENSIQAPETLLAGVTFRGGAKLHVADEDAVKKRLKVEGSMEERRLVLTIQKPNWEDAGTYICFATALSQGYQLVDYTASANLTVLGDKGSSALLLAKQQVLETHQDQLERQTVILQEELQHLQQSRQELLDKVHLLEDKHEDLNALLTQFLNSSTSPNSRTDSTQQHSSAGSNKAEATPEVQLEMIQIKSRLDILQNNVISQLKNKLKGLETKVSGLVSDQLKSIRQRLEVVEQAKGSKGSSPGTQQGSAAGLENLPKVLDRLDALEHRVVEEISQKVTRLEEVDVKNVRDRLDRLELHTLKDMDTRVEAEKGASESNKKHLTQIESDLQALLGKLHRLKTECYVCGNITTSQQCSAQEARKKVTVKCPLDTGYCMNDVIQDAHGRKIYKRCVSRDDCVELTKKSSKRCAEFTFMTLGPVECHFCCAYSKCNEQYKPENLYHF